MTTLGARLRDRIFTPDPAEVTFAKRGFPPAGVQQANLEKIGTIFLTGFGYGMRGSRLAEIGSELETVEHPFRGFAYEGCSMALAIRDSIRPAGQHWIADFLAGQGARHVYMVHIGVGWAMARVPRLRWRTLMPANQLLRWLALDGYGFHQAYFRTGKYVTHQFQEELPTWRPAGYANRVVDQGIGRALWFINGSDVPRVAATIGGFPAARRSDLWSGAGLASVYAGGADTGDLDEMAELAGPYRADLAQAAAFAAKARLLAGLVTPHTKLAVKVYCDCSVEEAAAVTDDALDGLPDVAGQVPGFEVWRQRIREHFA
jgi:enediyne biosynthesis protein E3